MRYGSGAAHRKQVDQAAANAEFAGRHDLRHVLIAGERELRAQRVDVERFALLQEEREAPRDTTAARAGTARSSRRPRSTSHSPRETR